MTKVIVIGAGASGIITALKASEKNEVILVDGNSKCGKKILLTGNGRCNYWNQEITLEKYETNNPVLLKNILKEDNIQNTYQYLESLGLYPKIKEGYYYPYSNQATSVREIFERQLIKKGIPFIPNFKVQKIEHENNQFIIYSDTNEKLMGDKLVLATGSKAMEKTGSDGSGYTLANSLGHTISPVLPALTGLVSNASYLKEWDGIRCSANLSLFINKKKVKEENGEIQLTKNGISGICTFNISSQASKSLYSNEQVEVSISFLPFLNNNFIDFFEERNQMLKNPSLEELFETFFSYKLLFLFFKLASLEKDTTWNDLTEHERKHLEELMTNFKLSIIATEGYEKAQVCTGGIYLNEIDEQTLESKKVSNLYFTGEILDVDGKCGGYNLAFAFITGFIVGSSL